MNYFVLIVLVVSLVRLGFKGYKGGVPGAGADELVSFSASIVTDMLLSAFALWLLWVQLPGNA